MQDTRNIKTARELIDFVRIQTASRGWGRGLRTTVSEWYMRQPIAKLAVEVLPDLPLHRQIVRRAKAFAFINGELYKRSVSGVFQRCVSPEEGQKIL